MKPYIIISGLNLRDNNRGTAALSYGSFYFLHERGLLPKGAKILNVRFVKNFLRPENRGIKNQKIDIDGTVWEHFTVNVFFIESILF